MGKVQIFTLSTLLAKGRQDGSCLLWPHTQDKDGYGAVRTNYKVWRVHRLAFFLANGHLPPIVRHACDNPPCFLPMHLLSGSRSDNSQDMVQRGRHPQAAKTHCPAGHEYPEASRPGARQGRKCRECNRLRMARKKRRDYSGV